MQAQNKQKQRPFNAMTTEKILRVALYIRVSTEEQVLHGYSLDAQEEELIRFAAEHQMKVVGIFRDEGNSARKPALKRKVMQELLEVVKAGEVDQIIFIKMDRWFRNVREYHKVQEILDDHNVTWRATMEEYNTETADGRLKVNIMLSVAENESDRTSERIKFVLDAKRRRKELAFGGHSYPYGYMPKEIDGIKRLVKDPETEEIVADFWDYVRKYNSVRLAGIYCNQKYGLTRHYRTWVTMGRNEIYTGDYKGVAEYCEPYIPREEWEYIMQSHVKIKKTQRPERVYLFTGMLRCPCCGVTLKGTFKTYPNDRSIEYKSYRCNNSRLYACEYRPAVAQKKLEKYLLNNVEEALRNFIIKAEVEPAPKKKSDPAKDLVKLSEQLRRLNTIYMSGNIDDDEYTRETNTLKKKIEETKKAEQDGRPPDLEVLKQFLDSDFKSIYATLSEEDKRRMWRSIISEIHFEKDSNKVKEIVFRA